MVCERRRRTGSGSRTIETPSEEPENPAQGPPLPDPLARAAEDALSRLEEAAAEAGVELPPRARWPGEVERVWACSEFVAESCIRDPALLAGLLAEGALAGGREAQAFRARAAEAAGGADSEAALMRALRLLRRREALRIAWRDLGGCADFEQTVAELSALAEAIIEAALARLHGWQRETLGEPRNERGEAQQMVVLALGKLGAGELNFSSDVDLVFAFPETGHTAGGRRLVSNEEYFLRLGRRLIDVLSRKTEHGFVFRVDMRLRPFGGSGPLAISFNALEDYYQIHGRDWERYALIRARAVAGDLEAGRRVLERLRPFVYRRYIDFGALESLREMKRLIVKEVSRKGMEDDIKLGPGGIREIEFVGQAFQLVRGGRRPDLRDRSILRVLERLGEIDYLPGFAVRQLRDAYRLLRTTEHRLQQVADRQTHRLPAEPEARARLAAGLRYPGWEALARDLGAHRQRVHDHFEQVFAAPQDDPAARDDALDALWEEALAEEEGRTHAEEALRAAGFARPAEAWARICRLRESYSVRALGATGRQRIRRLMPLLLGAVARGRHPELTLQRVLEVVEAIARRSVYLSLLVERPLALSQLVQLCEASPWIARQIARYPLLLDELLDARTLYAPLGREALAADLAERMGGVPAGDTEQELDFLRQFKQTNTLRVAAADVTEALPLMVVSDHLTAIAEVCLEQVLALARRDLVARHGRPMCRLGEASREAGFIVVAYGKLGGLELGYASDLDLVFLHGSTGEAQRTEGPREVDNAVFFGRLGQRLIHFLTARTPAGSLYEVDPRLRPSGASGLLVSGIDAFAAYQQGEAWTWEHQALVRARPVAGDRRLAERFAELRREVLCREREPEALRREVRGMRDRMRRELGSRGDAGFDVKQDPGGIADIEFMVQYGVLRWARKLGDFLQYTDNVRLLHGFARHGLLPADDTELLADAYRAYRTRMHALALQEQRAVVEAGEFREYREAVTRIWRGLMEA